MFLRFSSVVPLFVSGSALIAQNHFIRIRVRAVWFELLLWHVRSCCFRLFFWSCYCRRCPTFSTLVASSWFILLANLLFFPLLCLWGLILLRIHPLMLLRSLFGGGANCAFCSRFGFCWGLGGCCGSSGCWCLNCSRSLGGRGFAGFSFFCPPFYCKHNFPLATYCPSERLC